MPSKDQFPSKLYEMLESADSLGLSHIVSWLSDGKSFEVKDQDQFMHLIVPRFFKATKYRSFQRQLNLWDFKRIAKEDAATVYWQHKYFIRGYPELLSNICRTQVKNKSSRKSETSDALKEAQLLQTHSDDSLEGASRDCNEEKGLYYGDTSVSAVPRQHINNTGSYFVPPLNNEVFESSMFCESAPNQNQHQHTNNIDQMCLELEPLPIDSVGILDSTSDRNKSDLAEFGQLLRRL